MESTDNRCSATASSQPPIVQMRDRAAGPYLNLQALEELPHPTQQHSKPSWSSMLWPMSGLASAVMRLFHSTVLNKDLEYKEEKYRQWIFSMRAALPDYEEAHELVKLLHEPQRNDWKALRTEFLVALRESLQQAEYQQRLLLLPLCAAVYTAVNLTKFYEQLIAELLESASAPHGRHTELQQIHAIDGVSQENLGPIAHLWWHSLCAHIGFGFDTQLTGNVPHYLFSLKHNERPLEFLRLGTPTQQDLPFCSSYVDPIFEGFIEYLEKRDLSLFYTCLMSINGNESKWFDALLALHRRHPRAFDLIALDQDSDWANREEPIARDQWCTEWSQRAVIGRKCGMYLQHTSELALLLQSFSQTLFPGEDRELSGVERLGFKQLWDAMVVLELMSRRDHAYANATCRDAADRASRLVEILLKLLRDDGTDPLIERIALHGGAINAKKRGLSSGRRRGLVAALDLLACEERFKRIRRWIHQQGWCYSDVELRT